MFPVLPESEIVVPELLQTLDAVAVAVPPTEIEFAVIARLLAEPVEQLLLGVTTTSPDVEPQLSVIEVVP
jgi:hypothetical protein